jgi:hypothetical protein
VKVPLAVTLTPSAVHTREHTAAGHPKHRAAHHPPVYLNLSIFEALNEVGITCSSLFGST